MIRVKGYLFQETIPIPHEYDYDMTIIEFQNFLQEQKIEYYMFIWKETRKD